VIRRIVKLADQHKDVLTFILAGYEKDIESKVFAADPGLPRRFPNKVIFKDYTAPELAKILEHKVGLLEAATNGARHSVSREAAQAFGRRLARGAGVRGFGNGGAVLTRLSGPVMDRWRLRVDSDQEPTAENMVLTVEDMLGPPPDPTAGAVGAILGQLGDLPGLQSVKAQFASLVQRMRDMYDADLNPDHGAPHLDAGLLNRAFLGGPGTFKTTVAELYGRLLAACGFLTDGEVVRVKPADLLAGVVGESEQKTRQLLERCAGKVLFIDEAYGIAENSTFGPAVLTTLVGELPDKGGADMAVVMAGYEDTMTHMLDNGNPGLASRFPAPHCRFEFANLGRNDLRTVVARGAKKGGLPLTFAAADACAVQLVRESTLRNFGNARECGALVERLRAFVDKGKSGPAQLAAQLAARPLPEAAVVAMLEAERQGDPLGDLKLPAKLLEYVAAAGARARLAASRLQPPPELRHVRLLAPSGAGKTTCAELLARELYLAGVLARPKPVIVGAESLQAGFVGQSSGKMTAALQEAQGGLLFIDEAHNLKPSSNGGDFKGQVLATLVAAMTSLAYRGKLLVVIAGYTDEMRAMLAADQGLSSRFPVEVVLDGATAEACVVALDAKLKPASPGLVGKGKGKGKGGAVARAGLDEPSRAAALAYFEERRQLPHFGNLREAGTLAEAATDRALTRLQAQGRARGDAEAETAAELDARLQRWDGFPVLADVEAACRDLIGAARAAGAAGAAGAAASSAGDGGLGGPRFGHGTADASASASASASAVSAKAGGAGAGDGGPTAAAAFSKAEVEAGKLAHALLDDASEFTSPGDLVALLKGEASATVARRTMTETLRSKAKSAHLGLSDGDLDEVLQRIFADALEILDAAASSRDDQLEDLKRRRRLQRDGTAAAVALDTEMRRLCETETVTVTRTCGHCGRLDDPFSGCAYGGNTNLPIFVKNVERTKTYGQHIGAD
jgi:hypothetical protein